MKRRNSWIKRDVICFPALAAAVALLGRPAAGQHIEYTVTDLPQVPDAFSTIPLALNDDGVVVGWAQYSGGDFYLRGWRWSASEGLTILPPPPGGVFRAYSAVAINNAGMIAGDGGYDSGRVWRFENDEYIVLDSLPGLDGARGPAMNIHGDIVATAFDSQHFTTPTRALHFDEQTGVTELFVEYGRSSVGDINDVGQIVGVANSNAIRIEPDGQRTILPVPDGFVAFTPVRLNAAGDVAGIAACSHECNQAALWTQSGGYQWIPEVGVRHSIGGINMRQEVVGGVTEGVSYAWIWSPQDGLRLLASLIDPDLTRNVVYAMDINEHGQVLAIGYDYSANEWQSMLLTPVYWLTVENLRAGQDAILNLTGATPETNQYIVYSLRGLGSTFVAQLNVTLDLRQPVLLTSGRADADGNFTTTVHVPRAAAGRTVWFQGAQVNRTTNWLSEVVQ